MTDQDQQISLIVLHNLVISLSKQYGEYVKKLFWLTMIVFSVFQMPILAATTYAASNNDQFVAVCIICAAVLQRIAAENCFSMAINN